jgi:hypothetical protein
MKSPPPGFPRQVSRLGAVRAPADPYTATLMLEGWWTMEFVLFDIGATIALLIGYLTVVIRNGAL